MSRTGGSIRFDRKRAGTYDRRIRVAIPGYEAMHEAAHALLRGALPKKARVLVVGAGTGMELLTLGPRNPGWSFTATDPAAPMLEKSAAKVRRAGLAGRVALHAGTSDTLPPTAPFHGATALLVSHFITDFRKRRAFFAEIARRLRPGGTLVFADAHGDRRSPGFQVLFAAWKRLCEFGGIADGELRKHFRRVKKDVSFLPEETVRRLLVSAGFEPPVNFYRGLLFGGWVARKRG